jgi:hypothetical protein
MFFLNDVFYFIASFNFFIPGSLFVKAEWDEHENLENQSPN